MRKSIFKLMLVTFLLLVIAACSDKSSKDPSNADGDERVTIELLTNEHPSWPTDEDWLVWELMEEGGNMNLDVAIAADPYGESLNRVFASGNLPDLIGTVDPETGNRFGAQGALVNYLDHIDQMPHLKKWMEKFPDAARRVISHDGKMYVSPAVGMGETSRMLWLYRKDIFDEHGLTPPNNWDELYSVIKKLKEVYPDSYPFGFRNGTDKTLNLAPNFDTNSEYYYDNEKEEWRYGPIEDNYRVMLEYLHMFYEEGLIPTDFLSIETEEFQKIMSSDTSFITQDYISRIDMFNIPMRQENPDYTLIHMPPPAGFPDGKQLDYSNHTAKGGYLVPKDSDKIDTALRYVDWTFSEEGRDTLSWGVEGETYKEVNGEKEWIEDYKSPSELRSKTGISLFSTYSWVDYDSHMVLFSDEVKKAYEEDAQYDAPIIPTPAFSEEEQEKNSIQGEAIKKHRDEEIAKFIIGKRDLSEWDDYVEEMKGLGIEDLIDMYDKAYQRMLDVDIE